MLSSLRGVLGLEMRPLYTGRLFHCYKLDEYISHFRGIGSVLLHLFWFSWKNLSANSMDPYQTPLFVASDLGLHCLSMTLLRVSGLEWIK